MEQSVCVSLPAARLIAHMLPNSPFAAQAAVARLSKNAPASAGITYALNMVTSLVGQLGVCGPVFLHQVTVADATLDTPGSYSVQTLSRRWNPTPLHPLVWRSPAG